MIEGWNFTDAQAIAWQTLGPGVEMKPLGAANGRMIALFRFDAGYVGASHDHRDAEFSYVLEGELISNGVTMTAGHAYAAEEGTTHDEFRSDQGATLVSVFPIPSQPGFAAEIAKDGSRRSPSHQ